MLALQALYEVDSVGHTATEVLDRYIHDNPALSDEAVEFFKRLVLGTIEATDELDLMISECAPVWPVDELAAIDRNILRLALWEFHHSGETPVKVAINEAVELAKRYGSDSAPRFVNGVLGSIAA
jgi:N utilization substance protein B